MPSTVAAPDHPPQLVGSTDSQPEGLARALRGGWRSAWRSGWVAAALITVGAAALRFAHLGQVAGDPFYDGAVRSMGLSWHNFFFGAIEPSGAVAIDKPPVDLWLQVASVRLFGFGSTSLKLPEALAGTLAVPLLYAAVRPAFGVRAGLAAALALAVLPIEVITARSDTMDAVMMVLTVLALALAVRAAQTGRTAWLLAAAAALGIAFDVKLLESLVALPGLVVLAWLGLPGSWRRRGAQLALAGVVYVAVALAWLSATLMFPAHERPWAYGSTNGSAWNAAFVFNGLERLEGKVTEGAQLGYRAGYPYPEATQTERDAIPIPPPSATRLLDRIGPLSGARLGLEALAGLLLGGAALASLLWERRALARRAALGADGDHSRARAAGEGGDQSRARAAGQGGDHSRARAAGEGKSEDHSLARTADEGDAKDQSRARLKIAVAAGVLLWLITGIALFSDMGRLHPRYTEGFTPAVAAALGIGVAWVTGQSRAGRLDMGRLGIGRLGMGRSIMLTVTLLAVVVYAERLLFGTPTAWWFAAAGAAGAIALAWTGRPAGTSRPLENSQPSGNSQPPENDQPLGNRGPLGNMQQAGVLALTLLCLLAIPLWASLRAVRTDTSDTTPLGALHHGELQPLSAYLRAHQGNAYYEAAFDSGTKMGELVVRDGRPILVLTTLNGRVFTPVARLRALAAAGKVRYAFLDEGCGPHSPATAADCSAPARWVHEHATDVSRQAGMPRSGMLWRLPGPRVPHSSPRNPHGPAGAGQGTSKRTDTTLPPQGNRHTSA